VKGDLNMGYRLTNYHVVTDILGNGAEPSAASRLVYVTRTGMALRISDRMYRKLQERDLSDLGSKLMSRFFEYELLVQDGEDEFLTILNRNRVMVDHSNAMQVTIQPTADCQLGCGYCGQLHRKEKVSESTTDKIIARILDNLADGGYSSLHVQWFGAEPLMAYKNILTMSDRLIEACGERGVEYHSHMITNGLSFKPKIFSELARRGCAEFQITLDGLASTHNQTRHTKSGENTFDIILGNIVDVVNSEEFSTLNGNVAVRMNINKKNVHTISELIKSLADLGLARNGIGLDFQPIFDWGGNNANADSFDLKIEWIMQANDLGFSPPKLLPERRHAPCMVVDPHGEVYDVKGNIYPCYEFPYTEAYEAPEFRIGHLDTINEVKNDDAVTRKWFKDVEGDVAPCKTCNLFPVCGGGCPKTWLSGGVACPSFKSNIKERMALAFLDARGAF
jgi:uncharacterized protein